MHRVGILLSAFALVGLPATAEAVVRVDLSGYIYFNTSDVASNFPIGTSVTAWFTYDPDVLGQPYPPGGVLDPNVTLYDNAPLTGGMRVGDYKVKFSNDARMWVTNNEISGSRTLDRILFDDHYPIGGDVGGRPIDAISIGWQDDTATALSDMLLPRSQAPFDRMPNAVGSIDWAPYIGAEHRVSFVFSSMSVAAVPEPETWGLLVIGFMAIGSAARRQRLAYGSTA